MFSFFKRLIPIAAEAPKFGDMYLTREEALAQQIAKRNAAMFKRDSEWMLIHGKATGVWRGDEIRKVGRQYKPVLRYYDPGPGRVVPLEYVRP